jgi:1-acyl-sn-glycerol-3-phosphate acyltransferase
MMPALRLFLLACATLAAASPAALASAVHRGARGPKARAGARAIHLWARLACRALGIRVRAEGSLPPGACLVAANHLSYLDILVLASCYPGIFLSMAEVRGWPVVGALASLVGTHFIRRGRGGEVGRAQAAMARDLSSGLKVTLFPEGRTSCGRAVGHFHSALLEAAIAAGAPCVPVSLTYDTPPPAEPSLHVCWWGEAAFAPHFRRLLSLRGIDARVSFGDPLAPTGDRKVLARELQSRVQSAFSPVRQPAFPSRETRREKS